MNYPSHKGYDFGVTTERIIGACLEVHHQLGPGFREVVYQRALAIEFQIAGLDFAREERVQVHYKGKSVGVHRMDFLVEDVLLEIKAKSELHPVDHQQTLAYLKASGFRIGLLVNFGTAKLGIKRIVNG